MLNFGVMECLEQWKEKHNSTHDLTELIPDEVPGKMPNSGIP
jgi:hypothetical protein